jgi:hypothetical protein
VLTAQARSEVVARAAPVLRELVGTGFLEVSGPAVG